MSFLRPMLFKICNCALLTCIDIRAYCIPFLFPLRRRAMECWYNA